MTFKCGQNKTIAYITDDIQMWSEQNNCTRTTPACVTYILFTVTHRNYLKSLFLFPALQQITQTIKVVWICLMITKTKIICRDQLSQESFSMTSFKVSPLTPRSNL